MNRIEAFYALFGKNPDLACQEAVDVLLGDLDVRDDEQDELADIFDDIDSFQAGMDDYIDELESDDLRIPFLKQFLPTEKAEDKAPAKALVGVDDLDALLGGVGKREEVPEKKPKKVGGEVKAKVGAEVKDGAGAKSATRAEAEAQAERQTERDRIEAEEDAKLTEIGIRKAERTRLAAEELVARKAFTSAKKLPKVDLKIDPTGLPEATQRFLKDVVAHVDSLVRDLELTADSLRKAIAQSHSSDVELASTEAKLVAEISEVKRLKTELLTATTRLSGVDAQNSKFISDIAQLKADKVTDAAHLSAKTEEVTRVRGELASAQTAHTTTNTRLSGVEAQLAAKLSEIARLNADHHARIRLLDEATTELTETKTKLATSDAEVVRLNEIVDDAQYRLKALPQLTVINRNLTWQIHDLLKTPRFQEDRIKIEQAHSKTLNLDPNVQAQGRRELASWHAYMNSYERGNSGPDKILHGKHLLECIELLQKGTDPNSSGYLTRFVDGRSHP